MFLTPILLDAYYLLFKRYMFFFIYCYWLSVNVSTFRSVHCLFNLFLFVCFCLIWVNSMSLALFNWFFSVFLCCVLSRVGWPLWKNLFRRWRHNCSNCRSQSYVLFSSNVTYRIILITTLAPHEQYDGNHMLSRICL